MTKEFIKSIKTTLKSLKIYEEVSDCFNNITITMDDLSYDEYLVQVMVSLWIDNFKMPYHMIVKKTPKTYHWILIKICRHTIFKRKFIQFANLNKHIQEADKYNKTTNDEFLKYQQLHKPIRNV